MKKLKYNHAIDGIVERYGNNPYYPASVDISEPTLLSGQEPVRVTEAQPGGGCGLFVRFTASKLALMPSATGTVCVGTTVPGSVMM